MLSRWHRWARSAAVRGLVDRPQPRRSDGKNAALPFDQDITRVGSGGCDQRNSTGQPQKDLLAYPLRQGADFSKASAGEQQPDLPPIAKRRKLVWPRDSPPGVFQSLYELRSKGLNHR